MGPPWSKMGDMETLVTEVVGGKKIDLILDFRPRLPDITHNQKWYGKMGGFRGFYCCFGGPLVPDGQYKTSGDRWEGWNKLV